MKHLPEAPSVRDARLHHTSAGETQRAAVVDALGLVGICRTQLDAIVASASRITGAPIAAVTVQSGDEQFLVARTGTDLERASREVSFCTHVTARCEPLVVRDATRDPYFANHPLVRTDGTGFRAYCGVPITVGDGTAVAVLCVLDGQVRDLGAEHVSALEGLARAASGVLQGLVDCVDHEVLDGTALPDSAVLAGDALPLEHDPLFAWIERSVPATDQIEAALEEPHREPRRWGRPRRRVQPA